MHELEDRVCANFESLCHLHFALLANVIYSDHVCEVAKGIAAREYSSRIKSRSLELWRASDEREYELFYRRSR